MREREWEGVTVERKLVCGCTTERERERERESERERERERVSERASEYVCV